MCIEAQVSNLDNDTQRAAEDFSEACIFQSYEVTHMPIKAVNITIDREQRSITPGAVRGQAIIHLASIAANEQVLLEVTGDVDIPLAPEDIIFIRGGEKFSIGDGQPHVEENPMVRKPVAVTLNDQPLPESCRTNRAKVTGAELKSLSGGSGVDLWVDLDGLADEVIEDGDRIILQFQDRFFTVQREHEDRFYEVTVILDGEDRDHRFPAMMTVREATRRSLPPRDRPQVNEFDLADGNVGTAPLNPDLTLKQAGVRDGHTLSITKKNGGGG